MKKLSIALVIVVSAVLFFTFDGPTQLQSFLSWAKAQGNTGIIFYILAYVLATVLFAPGSILTLGAGFIYGVVKGTIIVSISSVLGASLAFLLGRYLLRETIQKKANSVEKFKLLDEAVGREGKKIVFLARLSPVFPFNLLNYMFGLTQVSFKDYVLASWIGMLPGTVLYVYLGSAAGSLATLGAGGGERSPAQWAVFIIGLLATAAITIYLTKLAKGIFSTDLGAQAHEA